MGQDAAGPAVSGWEKVIAATVLAVIGLVGLNLAIWRRMRVAGRRERQQERRRR